MKNWDFLNHYTAENEFFEGLHVKYLQIFRTTQESAINVALC
jgi:hypothetical protein